MTMSVGAATDYLVTAAQQSTSSMAIAGESVMVVDGWPYLLAPGMFVVGLSAPPPEPVGETAGTRSWKSLGAKNLQEDYTIPCYIDVRYGNATQKQVRDDAQSIFDAFWAQIVTDDLVLGGAIGRGGWAEISDFSCTPSNAGTAAEQGRRQLITFGLHCRNRTS